MNPYSTIPYSHNSLKVFEVVARHMSFTLAANELHVTQSAVSRQVKQLEDELNASLIIRGHRSIQLTLKGKELYDVLGRNYLALQSLLDSWRMLPNQKIVIRAALSFATRALLPKIHQLSERYPNNEIVVIPVIDEEEGRRAGDYDLFVFTTRYGKQFEDDPDILFLREEYMAPVCTKPLMNNHGDMNTLLSLPRLHPTLDHHDWQVWLKKIGHIDNEPVRNSTFYTLDLTLSACLSGQGVAVTDLLLALPELEREYLFCPQEAPVHYSAWRYYCHKRTDSPIVDELVEWLKQETQHEIERLTRLSQRHNWGLPIELLPKTSD
ncbi:LysR family transcriptional regulator [Vibrio methylphosphonaticus]|uniref:LysR family transcriptional regulator n=1 Tax=Vibrio methylphosphonaticus TaxID=2946866 RepID=UPI00202A39EB|nr:LysR family transcriptional regulator [Vibrio methylphosphonaticus]MCL9773673.1 LysR family transcriptional regulator [Vibrio methylphosphonaticus]